MVVRLQGIDPEKCRQRNRVMALRYGLETAGLEAAQQIDPAIKPDFARGHVPGPDRPEEALALINALRPKGSPELTQEDVYILPVMQSANTNFVGDRHMFLGSSSLKNIQAAAASGFAFMNSHRTGDLSTPSEQPFGRTYAGRYERYPAGALGAPGQMAAQAPAQGTEDAPPSMRFERTLLGTYMMRGINPNGIGGPSSDDMYRQIMGGVLHDVSMGLNGGQKVCDVCGNEVRSEDCSHVPGASTNMNKEQSLRQRQRGVPKGHATYTLEDAHAHEVSGVYDGAIPGAGFAKALEYVKLGRVSPQELLQIASAYSGLLEATDMDPDEQTDPTISDALEEGITQRIMRRMGIMLPGDRLRAVPVPEAPPTAIDAQGTATATFVQSAPKPPTAGLALLEQAEKEAALERRASEAEAKTLQLEARERHAFADRLVEQKLSDGHLFDAGAPAATLLFRWLSDIDAIGEEPRQFTTPLGNTVKTSLVALASSVFDEVPQHDLLSDHAVPEGAHVIPAQELDIDLDTIKAREDAKVIKGRDEKLSERRARKGKGDK